MHEHDLNDHPPRILPDPRAVRALFGAGFAVPGRDRGAIGP